MKGAIFSLSGIEIGEGAFYSNWYWSVSERDQHCWDARGGWGRVEGASPHHQLDGLPVNSITHGYSTMI